MRKRFIAMISIGIVLITCGCMNDTSKQTVESTTETQIMEDENTEIGSVNIKEDKEESVKYDESDRITLTEENEVDEYKIDVDNNEGKELVESPKIVLPYNKSELNIRGSWVSTDRRYNYFIDGETMYVRDAYKEDQTYTLTKIDIGENDIEIKGHKVGSDEIFSFKVENNDLIIDGIILERVPDIYMLQLLGEWESEIDGYVFQKDGSYQSTVDRSNWGSFFVLNDHEIAMGRMDAFFEIKEYSIENDELMIKGVSPKLRHKDGYKNSYSQLKDLYDIICGGIWVNEFENRAYRFFDDGIYKKYELSYFGDADERGCGTFIIYDNKKIYGYSGFEPFEAPEVCDYNEETGILRFGENLHRID